MTDESYSFSAAKTRLDEIVTQVRKKDTSLEKSLDLLEEGVRLANVCTELIDHADWASTPGTAPDGAEVETSGEVPGEASDDAEVEASDEVSDDAAETIGDVWSEDEAWADEAEDDPSDGDDGHGV